MSSQIRAALAARSLEALVASRPMDETDAPYWPRIDYAVLLPVDHLVDFMLAAEELTEAIKQFPDIHRVTIVPVREGLWSRRSQAS